VELEKAEARRLPFFGATLVINALSDLCVRAMRQLTYLIIKYFKKRVLVVVGHTNHGDTFSSTIILTDSLKRIRKILTVWIKKEQNM